MATALGVEVSVATWLMTLFMVFGLSLGLSLIRSPFLRKVYSTTFGLILAFYLNGFAYSFVLLTILAVYVPMALLPRNQAVIVGNLINVASLTIANWWDF